MFDDNRYMYNFAGISRFFFAKHGCCRVMSKSISW